MQQTKQVLREGVLEARLAIPIKERLEKNKKITSQLKKVIDWKSAKNVHMFVSIAPLGEYDTEPLKQYLKDNYPKLNLYYPRKFKQVWHDVDDNNVIADGICYDVVIVPTLGFDSSLNRIGYGGGYYDRFLAKQNEAQFIGVCYEVGHIEDIPAEPHDIRLNFVVTEKQVYRGII